MNQKNSDGKRTKKICSMMFLILALATGLAVTSISDLPANGQTLQEKCTPDSGVNISKSNCFSTVPSTVGENMTGNITVAQ